MIAVLLYGSLIALFNMIILRDRPSDLYSLDKVKERLFGKSMQIIGITLPVHTFTVPLIVAI